MKTISRIRRKAKNIWKFGFLLMITATTLSCSKEDNPEMEASLLAASSQELVLGKWYVNMAPSIIASHCLAQYYLDFKSEEVKNVGALGLIHEQVTHFDTTIPLTKICELPDEITYAYSWAGDQDLSVLTDSGSTTLTIILVSQSHLILHNKATDKMMVLKRKP